MKIEQTSYADIKPYRNQYFSSLVKFQDVFLDFLVKDASYYKLFNNQLLGYAIVTHNNTLVEWFIEDQYTENSINCFNELVKTLNIQSIYCKSFDFKLLNCCLSKGLPYNVIGCLFREFADKGIRYSKELTFRYANTSDLPFLMQQEDEVFEPKELLESAIEKKGIIIHGVADNIIACGFLTQITDDYNYYDLGIWVNPGYRRKGFAAETMLYMMNICAANGWTPICGCDVKNTASHSMLNKIGFVSNHTLIEFNL